MSYYFFFLSPVSRNRKYKIKKEVKFYSTKWPANVFNYTFRYKKKNAFTCSRKSIVTAATVKTAIKDGCKKNLFKLQYILIFFHTNCTYCFPVSAAFWRYILTFRVGINFFRDVGFDLD